MSRLQRRGFLLGVTLENQPLHSTQTETATPNHLLRNIAFIATGIALLLATSGISYQAIESRADAHRFHQEGKSVDDGDFRLNIDCAGKGSPTVVLESGLGTPAIGWHLVYRPG